MSTRKCPPQSWFRSPTEEAVIRKISHEERVAKKRGQAARPPLPRSQITQTIKSVPNATPAANKAITNITSRENHERPAVYIASPYKGDNIGNVKNAIRYCKFAVRKGYFPIAPHIWLPLFLDDENPDERSLALSFGLRLLNGVSELWVFGERISEGMRGEIERAEELEIPVRYFGDNLKEMFPHAK
jgi:hypothetical protein